MLRQWGGPTGGLECQSIGLPGRWAGPPPPGHPRRLSQTRVPEEILQLLERFQYLSLWSETGAYVASKVVPGRDCQGFRKYWEAGSAPRFTSPFRGVLPSSARRLLLVILHRRGGCESYPGCSEPGDGGVPGLAEGSRGACVLLVPELAPRVAPRVCYKQIRR